MINLYLLSLIIFLASCNPLGDKTVVNDGSSNPIDNGFVSISSPSALSYVNSLNENAFSLSGTCSSIGGNITVSSGVASATTTCAITSTWSVALDVHLLPDIPWTVTVEHVSLGGLLSYTATRDFNKLVAIPGTPTLLTLITPATSPNPDPTPTIQVDGVASGLEVSIYSDAACSLINFKGTASATGATVDVTLQTLSSGVYNLFASATDIAGNTSACSAATLVYEVDSSAPTVAITTPAASSFINAATNTTTFTVSGTCSENGRTVAIQVDGVAATSQVDGSCDGTNFTSTIDVTGLSNGAAHSFTAVLSDAAGNSTTSAAKSVTKDITSPTVAISAPANSSYINAATNTTTFTVSGTCSETGRTVAIEVDAAAATSQVGGSCNGTTFTSTVDVTGLSDNTAHSFTAVLSDAAGNSTTSAAKSVTKQSSTLTVALSSASSSSTNTSPITIDVTFSASVSDFALTDIAITGTASGVASNLSGSGTTYSFDITPGGDGTVIVNLAAAAAHDDAANPNTAAAALTRTYDVTAPYVVVGDPSDFIINGNGSIVYTLTYTGASAITLANGNVNVTYTGHASGCTVGVSGTGLINRTVTLSACSGSGGVAQISLVAGTGSDAAGNTTAATTLSKAVIIDTGLKLWLSADKQVFQDNAGTVPASTTNDVVALWNDRSSAGVMTTAQTTNANRPHFISSSASFNNQPVIRFNGSSSFLSVASSPTIKSMIVVGKYNSNQVGTNWISGTGDFIRSLESHATSLISWYRVAPASTFAGTRTRDTNAHIFAFDLDNYVRLAVDGEAEFRIMATTLSSGTITDIGQRNGGGQYLDGDIAEVLLFDRALSVAERQLIETNLALKYSISTVLSNNLLMWLKADSGVTTASGKVTAWTDNSSNVNSMTQTTAASRPSYVTNTLNGLPVIRFNGTDQFLNFTSMVGPANYTLISLLNSTGTTGNQTIIGSNQTPGGIYTANGSTFTSFPGVDGSSAGTAVTWSSALPTAGAWYNLATNGIQNTVTALPSGNVGLNVNGVEKGSKPTSSFNKWYDDADTNYRFQFLGKTGDVANGFFKGDISELFLYSQSLPTADTIRTQQYLATKYQTTPINPPAPLTVPGVSLWLRADNGVTKGNDNKVSFWNDQLGISRLANNGTSPINVGMQGAIQPTAGNKPLWVDNVINGHPVLRFSGSQAMQLPDHFAYATKLAIFAVVKSAAQGAIFAAYDSGSTYQASLTIFNSGGLKPVFNAKHANGNRACVGNTNIPAASAPMVLSGVWSSVSRTNNLWMNGAQVCTNATTQNSGDLSAMTGGQYHSFIGFMGYYAAGFNTQDVGFFTGDIAELIFVTDDISASDRQLIECYLNAKYNLGVTGC